MRIKSILTEAYECVKIGGILRNLSNDEMKVYKKVKEQGRVFKAELSEYDANVATTMVSKGLLRRKKAQHDEGMGRIYYTTIGRKGHLVRKEIDEVAPPGQEAEKWIKKNKKRFKDKYGKDYEKYLYGKAWNNYNGKKKVNESVEYDKKYKEFIPAFFDLYDFYEKVKDRLSNNDYRVSDYQDLYDKALDTIRKLNWNSSTREITEKIGFIENACDDVRSWMQDAAVESGDYDAFNEGEYDPMGTRDNIHNMGISTFLDRYIDESNTLYFWKRIKSLATEMLMKIQDESSEPEFNGNFDEIQTPQPEPLIQVSDEIKALQEIIKNVDKMIANPDDRDLINYYYDDFYEIYQYNTFNSVDKLNDKFLELLFDYVDENFAGEENDFVSRGEREYNSDETYENVSNESTYDLMVKFFDKNDADTFLDRLSELEDIKNYIDKHLLHNSSDEQDEDSGDEYDE